MSKKSFSMLFAILAISYLAGYGVARWRGFIVMKETHIKEQRVVIKQASPGIDMRETEWAKARNSYSPVVFSLFLPLAMLEGWLRGGTSTY